MSTSLKIGTVLYAPEHDYTILKVLGQGGFGITYLAETELSMGHLKFKAKVAVKEHFISSLCSRDGATHSVSYSEPVAKEVQNSLRAFVKEARRLHDLGISHPNIVKVNEVFEANNTAYYVMEYLDGESLDKYVKRVEALPEAEVRELLLPLVHAVSQLHRNKVAHYDIKPQNIMLAKDENGELQPTLIDFGLAKHYDNQGHATSSIMAAGYTPGYAPVEQYGGISTYSPQCDVYSLGATLYFCLTGKDPAVAFTLKTAQVSSDLEGCCSENMRNVILHALQKEAEDRYPDATSMFDDLCGDGYDSGATVKKPKPGPVPPIPPTPTPTPTPVARPRRNWRMIGIAAAVVVAVAIMAIIFLVNAFGSKNAGMDSVFVDTVEVAIANDEVTPEVIAEEEPAPKPKLVVAVQEEPKPVPVQAVQPTSKPEPVQPAQPEPKQTSGYINGHEYVDLGLPSGLKWATCNVGASSPSGYGNYYAWGETSTKSEYWDANSKTYDKSCYDNIGGNSGTDAACANWGGTWRLPTNAEYRELLNKCTWTWTTQSGHNGYKVKGPNGNTVFLPAAGYRRGTSLNDAGGWGYYWSSTPASGSNCAYGLGFDSSYWDVDWRYRYVGFSVRPVLE